jgi:hypothetical protein
MIINSHLLIANHTANYVAEHTGFGLNRRRFCYGNIKPDIDAIFQKYPHDFGGSIELVKTLIEQLIEDELDAKKFSEMLGVINHFLSDYFCAYHSYYYLKKRNIVVHLIYETLLHHCLRYRSLNQKKLNALMITSIVGNSIDEIIRTLRNEYYNCRRSIKNDIKYALNATAMISTFIVKERLAKKTTMQRVA